MDVNKYLDAMGIVPPIELGGQELIFGEIVSGFEDCKNIYLPFPNHFLVYVLKRARYNIVDNIQDAEGIYFGTPTIVDNKALFPAKEEWTKKKEREFVVQLCSEAINSYVKIIISGLGSGDISLKERKEDIFKGTKKETKVICMKDFGNFKDWVTITKL
tara:strand:- start:362 stop:838 length:477 start_codon:yes stop_codon:yes gene_type:complete